MDVFGAYAQFYDLLYREKNYLAEVDFIQMVLSRHAQIPTHTILDLGCGTGGHAYPLAERGYHVTGVDQSAEMLRLACQKGKQDAPQPVFALGDIRTLDLHTRFDAVISMFAVISYMTTNVDLEQAFQAARRHLNDGGLFTFDAWAGPGVLNAPPTDRYKVVNQGQARVIRFVHPEVDVVNHTVVVNYRVLSLMGKKLLQEVVEAHPMRYLFPQEIAYFLEKAGFEMLQVCPFMDLQRVLTTRDWNLTVVARAR